MERQGKKDRKMMIDGKGPEKNEKDKRQKRDSWGPSPIHLEEVES